MPIAAVPRLRVIICIGLSILVLVSYWAVAGNQFVSFDDPLYVTENPQVQRGLDRETSVWAFTTAHACNWHPLTWLSLMLDRELYGMNAGGYHWTNVILHLLGGLFLFLTLSRMTAAPGPSSLVAALFLVHPLHVESVAWVAERKDVLSGLFWMLGLWCYAWYAERPGYVRYLGVVLSFTCGLLSKPMVVTFPFVLLLLDWWPLGRTVGGKAVWLRLLSEKIPLFLLSVAGSIITFLIQKESHAVVAFSAMPFGNRLANAAMSYAAYLGKAFWPVGLSVFYPYPGFPPFGRLVAVLALLILITGISSVLAKRRPYLLVGWFWYLGTLVPVIGLVQVGAQAMADRYTYLPLVGVFIMVVWGLKDLGDGVRIRRTVGILASCGLITVLVLLTQLQVRYWHDTRALFTHALQSTEKNFIAHLVVGRVMANTGDLTGAEKHYRESIRIRPSFSQTYNSLGHLLMIQGRQDEASVIFEKALQIDPGFVLAIKNLGDVRARQGRIEDALPLYQRAVLLSEEDPELLNNYGVALFLLGRRTEAFLRISAALRLNPDYAAARNNLRKIESGEVSPAKVARSRLQAD